MRVRTFQPQFVPKVIIGAEMLAHEEGFTDYAEMREWFLKNHAKTFRKVGHLEAHIMEFRYSINPPEGAAK